MITQEGVHNIFVESLTPHQKMRISYQHNNDPEKIKHSEQLMADALNKVVDIVVNPGTTYLNTRIEVDEPEKGKLITLRDYIEHKIGDVPAGGLSVEALLSIAYSKNVANQGPSITEILKEYTEYLEEFLSTVEGGQHE